MQLNRQFNKQGYVVIDSLIEPDDLHSIAINSALIAHEGVGTRNLLELGWVQELAQSLKSHPLIKGLLPSNAKAVQCNYFLKNEQNNWSVTLHRDLSIAVKHKVDSIQWSAWSKKEGVLFVQPPKDVLDSLVVLRLHLEENTELNGPLDVVPMSHRNIDQDTGAQSRKQVKVHSGGALLMKPLLLHASTKVVSGQRRVLHFVFGPSELSDQVKWQWAV